MRNIRKLVRRIIKESTGTGDEDISSEEESEEVDNNSDPVSDHRFGYGGIGGDLTDEEKDLLSSSAKMPAMDEYELSNFYANFVRNDINKGVKGSAWSFFKMENYLNHFKALYYFTGLNVFKEAYESPYASLGLNDVVEQNILSNPGVSKSFKLSFHLANAMINNDNDEVNPIRSNPAIPKIIVKMLGCSKKWLLWFYLQFDMSYLQGLQWILKCFPEIDDLYDDYINMDENFGEINFINEQVDSIISSFRFLLDNYEAYSAGEYSDGYSRVLSKEELGENMQFLVDFKRL
jgi:hypothetical protein